MSSRVRFWVFLLAAGLNVFSIPFAKASAMQQGYASPGQQIDGSGQLQNFSRSRDDQEGYAVYWIETGAKFANSIANMVASPVEIPKNIINTANDSNLLYGLTGGSVKGIVNMGGRILVGLADFLTFPLPTKPIAYPLYVWEDFDSDTSYGEIFSLQE
ncbi:MAG: exosortase system-associated protein, TIGR04073 family [Gammaproteobacteria bacterium]